MMGTTTPSSVPVLASVARTPIGRFRGALQDVSAVDLGAVAIRGALERLPTAVSPQRAFLANVVQAGNGQNPARAALHRAGLPLTVPATTLNDVCLASLTAVGVSASMIRSGELDCVLVGGFESMSRTPHAVRIRGAKPYGDAELTDLLAHDGLTCSLSGEGMGTMTDVVNARLGIGRREQDEIAAASHERAQRAMVDGTLAREQVECAGLDRDEGIRPETTVTGLGLLRPAFTAEGTITAGNASQMSDAGAAGVMMSAGYARRHAITPLVEVVGHRTVSGPDTSLHTKPSAAAKALLQQHGMGVRDVDIWEINEAFASVVIASIDDLGIDLAHVNVNGGAIALGHPLAASGFRILATLALTMVDRQLEYGVATMCGGGGQGGAVLLRLTPGAV